ARKGEAVQIPAREVTIHRLDVEQFGESTLAFDVVASKGTYIRALARDIGRDLGCGGHLSALRRVRSGQFSIEDALQLDDIQERFDSGELRLLQGRDALPGLPSIELSDDEIRDLKNGKLRAAPEDKDEGIYAAYARTNDALQGLIELTTHAPDGD